MPSSTCPSLSKHRLPTPPSTLDKTTPTLVPTHVPLTLASTTPEPPSPLEGTDFPSLLFINNTLQNRIVDLEMSKAGLQEQCKLAEARYQRLQGEHEALQSRTEVLIYQVSLLEDSLRHK